MSEYLHSDHPQSVDPVVRMYCSGYHWRVWARRYRVIADIAGGTGALLAGLLADHPAARGVLFDQPQVVANAGPVLDAAGVDGRGRVRPVADPARLS